MPPNIKHLNQALVLLMPTKHMGNLLVSLHSIVALVKANRGRSLVVIDEQYRDILAAIPEVIDVVYYPRDRLRKGNAVDKLVLLKTFYATINAYKGSLLINFDTQQLATTMALMSGIKIRWGLSGTPLSRFYNKIVDKSDDHPHRFYDYEQYAHLLLGEHSAPQYPELLALEKGTNAVKKRLAKIHDVDQPFVCIHAGATKDYKRWPEENFSYTADWLKDQGYQVFFIGAGTSDRLIIEHVNKQCKRAHTNLCDTLSLGELIALFTQCAFFLGNDSGPMHLAAATGARVFALFGPTDEQRWGPLGSNAIIIRNPVPCSNACSKKSCSDNFRCLKSLSHGYVQDILLQYLIIGKSSRPAFKQQLRILDLPMN